MKLCQKCFAEHNHPEETCTSAVERQRAEFVSEKEGSSWSEVDATIENIKRWAEGFYARFPELRRTDVYYFRERTGRAGRPTPQRQGINQPPREYGQVKALCGESAQQVIIDEYPYSTTSAAMRVLEEPEWHLDLDLEEVPGGTLQPVLYKSSLAYVGVDYASLEKRMLADSYVPLRERAQAYLIAELAEVYARKLEERYGEECKAILHVKDGRLFLQVRRGDVTEDCAIQGPGYGDVVRYSTDMGTAIALISEELAVASAIGVRPEKVVELSATWWPRTHKAYEIIEGSNRTLRRFAQQIYPALPPTLDKDEVQGAMMRTLGHLEAGGNKDAEQLAPLLKRTGLYSEAELVFLVKEAFTESLASSFDSVYSEVCEEFVRVHINPEGKSGFEMTVSASEGPWFLHMEESTHSMAYLECLRRTYMEALRVAQDIAESHELSKVFRPNCHPAYGHVERLVEKLQEIALEDPSLAAIDLDSWRAAIFSAVHKVCPGVRLGADPWYDVKIGLDLPPFSFP